MHPHEQRWTVTGSVRSALAASGSFVQPMFGLRFLFALAEEQLASRTRRGFALLLGEPLRALGRRRGGIGRIWRDPGRCGGSLARCCILDLLRDVRELVEDHLKLALVKLFERADLLLEATQARAQILCHRMSPPRWVMIFGSPVRTFAA